MLLEDWQKDIVPGFVLDQNEKRETVDCKEVVRYIRRAFDITVDESTA